MAAQYEVEEEEPNSANSHLSLFVQSSAKFNQKLQTNKNSSTFFCAGWIDGRRRGLKIEESPNNSVQQGKPQGIKACLLQSK